ncbi:hypothetical protein [Nocardia farcinica]|uniref:hypothetical protein n=1 Tax=Nocardia farcinica TaxID=37329 RepID=UPI002458C670|nr:hypothetical protein [Nocardia farcinica]
MTSLHPSQLTDGFSRHDTGIDPDTETSMNDKAPLPTLPDELWETAAKRPAGTRFTQIPHWLLDAGASRVAVKVWDAIARLMNRKTRSGFPKRKTIAELIGMSPSAVDRGLRELRRLGALVSRPRWREDGGRSSNDYLLLWAPLEKVLTSGNVSTPLVKNDEAPSSGMTSPPAPERVPGDTGSATGGDASTSGETPDPLVKSDDPIGQLIQSYLEEGVSRGPVAPSIEPAVAGGDTPPPSTCPTHPNGTPDACGACGWHRRNRIAWDTAQAEKAAAERVEAERERAAEQAAEEQERALAAIDACTLCDDLGRRDGSTCDHRDHRVRRAAVATVRAELSAKPRRYSMPRWRERRRPADLTLPAPAPVLGVTA